MLNHLFTVIAGMSLTSAIAAVAVTAINALLRALKAPAFIRCALWMAVLFRLLCPVALSSDFSLFGWEIWARPAQITGNFTALPPETVAPGLNTGRLMTAAIPAQPYLDAITPPQQAQSAPPLALLWLGGSVLLLAYHSISYLRLKRGLASATHIEGNIYCCENLRAPFVCGFRRPKIYLPANLGATAYNYILPHEQAHITRRDYLLKPLWLFACCLHWFNPLAWWAFARMCAEMELSCDEAVLHKLGNGIKADYSRCLVALAGKQPVVGMLPGFGQRQIKGRVKNILGYRKPALSTVLLAALVVTATACAVTTNAPQPQAPQTPASPALRTDAELEQFVAERLAAYREMKAGNPINESGTLPADNTSTELNGDALDAFLQATQESEKRLHELEEELRSSESNGTQAETEELRQKYVAEQESVERMIKEILADRAATTNSAKAEQTQLTWPYYGKIIQGFGPRDLGYHSGLDIEGPPSNAATAAAAGEVTLAGWYYGYGNCVILDHGGGLETYYAHLSAFGVSMGDTVEQGQVIGYIGSTGRASGPQLHFEVRVDGQAYDPLEYLPQIEAEDE